MPIFIAKTVRYASTLVQLHVRHPDRQQRQPRRPRPHDAPEPHHARRCHAAPPLFTVARPGPDLPHKPGTREHHRGHMRDRRGPARPPDRPHQPGLPGNPNDNAGEKQDSTPALLSVKAMQLDGDNKQRDACRVAREPDPAPVRQQQKQAKQMHADPGQAQEQADVQEIAAVRQVQDMRRAREKGRRKHIRGDGEQQGAGRERPRGVDVPRGEIEVRVGLRERRGVGCIAVRKVRRRDQGRFGV